MTTVQETAPPNKNEQVPGFEYKFTITVLLAVMYLMLQRRGIKVSTSKNMVKCKINIDTD